MQAKFPTYLTLALLLALPPAAAAGDLSEEFQALETQLLQARLDGDARALEQLISPDFGYYQWSGWAAARPGRRAWRRCASGGQGSSNRRPRSRRPERPQKSRRRTAGDPYWGS